MIEAIHVDSLRDACPLIRRLPGDNFELSPGLNCEQSPFK